MTVIEQPAGNYFDKYNTRNPIARNLMTRFLRTFDELIGTTQATHALEVGCGEGELSIRLAKRGMQVRGYDIAEEAVLEARCRAKGAGVEIPFATSAIEDLSDVTPSPLVVCCEVLEHVADPSAGLQTLARLSQEWLIVSVPREPLWRALNVIRGKYLREFGNTPGHINHWSRPAFVELVSRYFSIVELRSPIPWTMLLCRRL